MVDREKKILVIMSTYNYGKFIDESIKSILNQTYNNLILCVVDDNSTDNTLDIIKSFNDDRISLIVNNINKGAYYCRNLALDKHMNDVNYWILHDSDDFMDKSCLEKMIDSIETNYACGIRSIRLNYYNNYMRKNDNYTRVLFSKKVFKELGYYDSQTRFGGDTEYFYRFKKYIGLEKFSRINEYLVYMYEHSMNETIKTPIDGFKREKYRELYTNRNIKYLKFKQ